VSLTEQLAERITFHSDRIEQIQAIHEEHHGDGEPCLCGYNIHSHDAALAELRWVAEYVLEIVGPEIDATILRHPAGNNICRAQGCNRIMAMGGGGYCSDHVRH
jgi:hypothetical protein